MFPLIDVDFDQASHAVAQVRPAAALVSLSGSAGHRLEALAKQIAARKPYLPLIAVDAAISLPENAIPFSFEKANSDRLVARLRGALRVRALHATVLRRLGEPVQAQLPEIDPARDATVLLLGRGGSYPELSVAFGERMGVVGALSIEAAASHLNNRDIDGIVLGEGFTPRVVDAFLTVLSEDARFRSLPIVATSGAPVRAYDLPNLETISGEPAHVVGHALPLIRQRAFEAQLSRTLSAIDAKGLLDPRTGLLTAVAFARDFTRAVEQSLHDGGTLSVVRYAFDPADERAQLGGARIVSRLMRQTDFGAAQPDGSVLVVFSDTDLRSSHAIARRLASVMRQTSHGRRGTRCDPLVTVATLLPTDSAKSLLARLYEDRRAAS